MTIEEKLSALKAINEEKDKLDKAIEYSTKEMDPVISVEGSTLYGVNVPAAVIKARENILKQYFIGRRMELISQAEQLMKSE